MSTTAERVAQRAAERVEALGASLWTCAQWAEREYPPSRHATRRQTQEARVLDLAEY